MINNWRIRWNKIRSKLNKIKILVLDLIWALRGHGSAWFLILSACCLAEFDTSVICHLLMRCLGLFLLVHVDMFWQDRIEISLQCCCCLLLQSMVYCEARTGCLIKTVCKLSECRFSSWISYLFSNVFLQRCHRGLPQTSHVVHPCDKSKMSGFYSSYMYKLLPLA